MLHVFVLKNLTEPIWFASCQKMFCDTLDGEKHEPSQIDLTVTWDIGAKWHLRPDEGEEDARGGTTQSSTLTCLGVKVQWDNPEHALGFSCSVKILAGVKWVQSSVEEINATHVGSGHMSIVRLFPLSNIKLPLWNSNWLIDLLWSPKTHWFKLTYILLSLKYPSTTYLEGLNPFIL